MLKKADRISSNGITASIPVQNGVIQTSERKQTEQQAFSHSRNTKQLHSINPLIINVCTRSKPNVNTFDQKITKRVRGPNKKDLSSIESADTPPDNPPSTNSTTPPTGITIGTQKDSNSNLGQGLKPVVTRTSNKIRRLIELQDWTAIKNFSKYWYSLCKELFVNANGCIFYVGKLYIPTQLRKTVIVSVHKTHPSQAGMIYLAQLVWYPRSAETLSR